MKQNTTFSARSFIASCVTSSLIIVWKGHSSLYSKHQFHKNKVFRRRNPFSPDELGTDVRQRCSCFPTVPFLSKPWNGFYEADHVERHYGGSVHLEKALGGAPNAVPPPPPIILLLDLSFCRPYLFSLSFLYFCPNTHLFSLFPPGKFVLDVRSVPAKNSHNISSVIKPNIYVLTSLLSFFSILPLSSLYLLLRAADCRLNLRHAGVLLVERRGSYPLIDLRILKSKSPF